MEVGQPWYRRHQGYLVLAIVLIFAVPLYAYQHHQDQKRTNISLTILRDDHNSFVCVIRKYILPTRARAIQASTDPTQSKSARARAVVAIANANEILDSLITIPSNYKCPNKKVTHQ